LSRIEISPQEVQSWRQADRLTLQTNLWELCKELYPPPKNYWDRAFHLPVCKFFVQKDPAKDIAEQDISRPKQRLYLDPRNHFKTTIDICDIVQWILCFPDVRVLIASGTREHAIRMLSAAKAHFQYNETIRVLFPELCPPAHKPEDFGKMDQFICPGRKDKTLREPTCAVASPDSAVASSHWDVLKFDDLVNETNSRTPEGIRQVNNWFALSDPLLEPYGYRDAIGTRYDFSDVYGEQILKDDDKFLDDVSGAEYNGWLIHKRGCYDADGNAAFPVRWQCNDCRLGKSDHSNLECSKVKLDAKRSDMGTFLFACQYLNEPVPSDSQMFPLPLIEKAFTSNCCTQLVDATGIGPVCPNMACPVIDGCDTYRRVKDMGERAHVPADHVLVSSGAAHAEPSRVQAASGSTAKSEDGQEPESDPLEYDSTFTCLSCGYLMTFKPSKAVNCTSCKGNTWILGIYKKH
jgi:hypothetical protein